MRDASELTNAEKVQIHFMFHEMKQGYVQIARMYDIKAVSVIDIISEVDGAKSEFQTREPVVYRKHYVNPNRGKARKSSDKHAPTVKSPVTHGPTGEALEALLNKFNK